MSVENDITVTAGSDFTTNQYKAVVVSGTTGFVHVTSGGATTGIGQTKAVSLDALPVRMNGISRFHAGETITGGMQLTAAISGALVEANSNSYILGLAITSVVSGAIGKMFITHAGWE